VTVKIRKSGENQSFPGYQNRGPHKFHRHIIGLYGDHANLLSKSLEYVQRTATQVLNAIGADDSSAPPT
jgi:hypothetical protein